MELAYQKNGDYYIPELQIGEMPRGELTKYGLMRKQYLKEHRKGLYTGLLLQGNLMEHLLEIQETAERRMEAIITQMMRDQEITEELKEKDPMEWTGKMNSIRSMAEETVFSELIYS